MWDRIKKILLIMIAVSLVLPTSALNVISSVYGKSYQDNVVDIQNLEGLNTSLGVSTIPQEETEQVQTEVSASVEEEPVAEGEEAPTEGEESVTEGEEAPTEGEEAPTEGEEAPTEGEEAPTEGEESVTEGEESVTEGEEAPTEEEEAPTEEEEAPTEEEEAVTEGEEAVTEGEEAVTEGEEAVTEGEEAPTEEEEAVTEEDESVNLDFPINPNITFKPNIRMLSQYMTESANELTSKSYTWNTIYNASSVADWNTSETKNPFPTTGIVDNNGLVWVDKSVTLDSSYDYVDGDIANGNFNVILSALGQEYTTTATNKVPADVVFVLDVSGSMKDNKVSAGQDQDITRAQAAVNAINTAITTLMSNNPNTRVGVVTFNRSSNGTITASTSAKILLPLASYTAGTNNSYPYLKYSESGSGSNKKYTVSHADGLSVTGAEISSANFENGTFTQAGLKKGANLLVNAEDKGDRIPALILLSDGRPTFGSKFYDNVTDKNLGDGKENNNATDGQLGYYTILTAQDQKNKISNSGYSRTPLVYTLGLGITDQFGKTVLNPIPENISLLSNSTYNQDEKKLKELLNATTNNPFNKTSYANYSQSGNFTASDLNSLLANMAGDINTIANSPLASNSNLTFTDEIGAGMEIKGNSMIVRYANQSCTFITTDSQSYSANGACNVTDDHGNSVSLNSLIIRVTTDKDGIQTLTWTIPQTLLPVYSHYDKYHLTNPIRLVYTVGLKNGVSEGIYYTNAFTGSGENITPSTTATFTLAEGNPYYSTNYSALEGKQNNSNNTGTANYSSKEQLSNKEMTVTLGNNGKVTLSKVTKDINVTKVWEDYNNKHNTRLTEIKVQLKQGTENYGEELTLNEANSWSGTWTNLPKYDGNGNEYSYSVVEVTQLSNYTPSYNETNGSFTITNTLNNITQRSVIKNWDDYDNLLGFRPTEIKVQLKQGTKNYREVLTLNEANSWSETWSDLPKYDEKGAEYNYSVVEVTQLSNYTSNTPSYDEENHSFTITNTLNENGTINLIKKGKNDDDFLTGVQFKLERFVDGEWTAVETLTTDNKGKISKDNLSFGRYRLTEIKASDGYQLLDSAIEFDLPYIENQVKKPNEVMIDAIQGNASMPTLTITVKNNPNGIIQQLPRTGGTGIMMYIVGGSSLIGLATILYSRQVRRKNVSKN